MKIKEMVEKWNIVITGRDSENLAIQNMKNITKSDIAEIKKAKPEIITFIKTEEEAKEKARIKKYSDLVKKIPGRSFKNTPDEKRFLELKNKLDHRYFSNPEDESLNWGIDAGNNSIRKEMIKVCDHELKERWDYTLTADIRKKVTHTFKCERCGLYAEDSVEEEVELNWN